MEVPLHQIRRPDRGRVRAGGHEPLVATHTPQPVRAHEPFDLTARHRTKLGILTPGLFAGELVPHLAHSVKPPTDLRVTVHPPHMLQHDDVALGSRGDRSRLRRVVRRRGDPTPVLTQLGADRLDPEPVLVRVDELDHHGSRGSSSREETRRRQKDRRSQPVAATSSANFSDGVI